MREFKTNTKSIISRENICVSNYLREVNHIKLISPEEEISLARIIKKGGREGEKAKEKLINANLRIVISVANTFKFSGMELCDLISEGNIGLIKAAENFDEKRGVRFITYAVPWIIQSINDAILNYGSIVRIPSNKHRMLGAFRKKRNEVMKMEGRELSVEEYAEDNNLSIHALNCVVNASNLSDSLDVTLSDDTEMTKLDMLVSDYRTDSNLDKESFIFEMNRTINSTFTEKEAYVIRHYNGIGCTKKSLTSIGEALGLSCERIRKINATAMNKLRKAYKAKNMSYYLAA